MHFVDCWKFEAHYTTHNALQDLGIKICQLWFFSFYDFTNWLLWSIVHIRWFTLASFKHTVKVLQMLVFKVQRESQLATFSRGICNTTLGVFFICHFVWFYNVKSTHFVNLNFFLDVYPNWLFVCKPQHVGAIWVARAWWWSFIIKSWCLSYSSYTFCTFIFSFIRFHIPLISIEVYCYIIMLSDK